MACGFGLANIVELSLLVTVLLAVGNRIDRMLILPALDSASACPINRQSHSVD